jgi:hypothetical protein
MAEPPPILPPAIVGPKFTMVVELTDKQLKRVLRRGYSRTMVNWGWYLLALCSLFCLISNTDWDSGLRGLLIVMTIYTLIAIIHFGGYFLKRSLWYSRMDHRRWEFEFDDYGVQYVTAMITARYKWTIFTRVDRKRDMWFLRIGKESGALPFPVSSMSPDLQDFILRKCSENGVEVK